MKKRILLLDTGKEWGGGTNSMIELLKRIDRERFDVTALFYCNYRKGKTSTLQAELAAIDIPLEIEPPRRQPLWAKLAKELTRGLLRPFPAFKRQTLHAIERRWRIVPTAERLAARLRDGHFDLLYMNNQPSSNLEGYLAAEIAGVPVVQHCRIETTLLSAEVNAVSRIAQKIVCVSNGVRDSLVKQGIPSEKCVVIYNGIDCNQEIPEPAQIDILPNTFVIGSVGTLVKRKCFDHLIKAVAQIHKSSKTKIACILVGEGPDGPRLRALADELRISELVHFVGFQETPLSWIKRMDIFVFPSRQEGFGRVLIESMLVKTPTIAADVIGPNEIIIDGESGYLYPHGDIDRLANLVVNLLQSHDKMHDIAESGQLRVRMQFSIDQYIRGVEQQLAAALA